MNPSVPDDLISAYFDGEVTPDEREAVERVLESSSELRQLLDDTSKLSALLHSFPREAAPASLSANVEAQIHALSLPVSPAVPVKRTLRREWVAFATGIMATVASLMVYVAMHPTADESQIRVAASSGRHSMSAPAAEEMAHSAMVANDSTSSTSLFSNAALESTITNGVSGYSVSEQPAAIAASPSMVAADAANDGSLSLKAAVLSAGKTADSVESEVQDRGNIADQFLPPLKEDVLMALQTGQVIVRQMVNPDHTVMVVELTVLDVEKGAEWMQWMFHKRVIGEINDRESLVNADRANGQQSKDQEKSSSDRKKRDAPDDLIVIYAQGPGNELADTIWSIDSHPELFRGWAPKPPIEISQEVIANLEEDSVRRARQNGANTPSPAESNNADPDLEAFSNQIVDSYVNSQARVPEEASATTQTPNQEVARNRAADTVMLRGVPGQAPAKPGSGTPRNSTPRNTTARSGKTDFAVTPPRSRKEIPADERALNVKGSRQENGDPFWAYAAYRVGTDQQQPEASKNTLLSQSSASNGQIALGNGLGTNTITQERQLAPAKQTQSNFDQRDPRRMRMLFVLKQAKEAPSVPQP